MLNGSCLCGSVAYEVDADPGPIVHCHCADLPQDPRIGLLDRDQPAARPLPLDTRRGFARGFKSSPGKTRYFCTQCGSHIVAERTATGTILLRMGCLDTAIDAKPKVHIWRSDAASWYDPKDQLPEWPEGKRPER